MVGTDARVLRPGPAVLLAVGHDNVGAGADAFDVRGEGGAAVPVIVLLPGDSGAEQVKLTVEGGMPPSWSATLTSSPPGPSPARGDDNDDD